jgi:Na+/proline symporter
MLPFFANKSNAMMTIFILPIAIQWWSVWYPGAEPGGGGYIAQRMLSAKDEKNAIGATLLFNFLHYAIRPWPWIVVALVSMVAFPFDSMDKREAARQALAQPETAALVKQYEQDKSMLPAEKQAEIRGLLLQQEGLTALAGAFPKVDDKFLKHDIAYPGMIAKMPRGLLGIIVASLIAAYMSTIATHLNWGSSYFVYDFYKRYLRRDANEKQLVLAGRLCMLSLLVLSGAVALWMTNAKASFDLMLQIGAGTGLIYILRWFWWRINAHSELSAMIISFAVACFFQWGAPKMGLEAALQKAGLLDVMDYSGWKLVLGILITTIGWVIVTLLTKPEKKEVLRAFYRKIQPGGPGWKKVVTEAAAEGDDVETEKGWDVPLGILCMMLGCVAIWGSLFATGNFLYGNTAWASVLAVIAVVSVVALMRLVGSIRVR